MENPSVIFGENCFDDSVMQNRLPKETYKALRRTIEEGRCSIQLSYRRKPCGPRRQALKVYPLTIWNFIIFLQRCQP